MPEWERLTQSNLEASKMDSKRFKMWLGPLRPMWIAEHFDVKTGMRFPTAWLRSLNHEHRFDADGASSKVVDTVEWRLPFTCSAVDAPITVMPRIRSMFRFQATGKATKRIEETAELPRRRVLQALRA